MWLSLFKSKFKTRKSKNEISVEYDTAFMVEYTKKLGSDLQENIKKNMVHTVVSGQARVGQNSVGVATLEPGNLNSNLDPTFTINATVQILYFPGNKSKIIVVLTKCVALRTRQYHTDNGCKSMSSKEKLPEFSLPLIPVQ